MLMNRKSVRVSPIYINIVTSITARPAGFAVILVVMYISIFKTFVIMYVSQSVML